MVVNLFQKMSNMAPILSFYFLNNEFRSQTRPYLGFKTNPRDTKDTVCCKCKFIEQHGNHFKCTYEKRTDHNRKAIKGKKYHICTCMPKIDNRRIFETLPKKPYKKKMMRLRQLHFLTYYVYFFAA